MVWIVPVAIVALALAFAKLTACVLPCLRLRSPSQLSLIFQIPGAESLVPHREIFRASGDDELAAKKA